MKHVGAGCKFGSFKSLWREHLRLALKIALRAVFVKGGRRALGRLINVIHVSQCKSRVDTLSFHGGGFFFS